MHPSQRTSRNMHDIRPNLCSGIIGRWLGEFAWCWKEVTKELDLGISFVKKSSQTPHEDAGDPLSFIYQSNRAHSQEPDGDGSLFHSFSGSQEE